MSAKVTRPTEEGPIAGEKAEREESPYVRAFSVAQH
jgi:hypothetical protein